MWDLLVRGGPVMVPIVLASVGALAMFFAGLAQSRRGVVLPDTLAREVFDALEAGEFGAARQRCAGDSSSLGRVLGALLEDPTLDAAELRARAETVGRREAARLERLCAWIGAIASIEPMLGLLGTVLGMISLFDGLSNGGLGDPRALAGGIGEALLTTAAGLLAAIPAFIAWRTLTGRVEERLLALEGLAARALSSVVARRAREAR